MLLDTWNLKNLKLYGMSSNKVSIEEARKRLGDYVTAAALTGTTTIITRNGRPAARIAPLEDFMTTTTVYGEWADVESEITVEATVGQYLGEFGGDFDVAAIVTEYRAAINKALPDGVSLNGRQFIGPYPMPEDAMRTAREAVESVNLTPIADKYDKTARNEPEDKRPTWTVPEFGR